VQHTATHCNTPIAVRCSALQCVAVCCRALQCVAVCCSVLHSVAACCRMLQRVVVRCSALQSVAVRCSMLQCVAVHWSVLQYVTKCVAVCHEVCCSMSHLHWGETTPRAQAQYQPWVAMYSRALHCVALCCSVLQYVAPTLRWNDSRSTGSMNHGVLHCVAVCCSVLQYVTPTLRWNDSLSAGAVPAVSWSVL